jgi:hypothetical protein
MHFTSYPQNVGQQPLTASCAQTRTKYETTKTLASKSSYQHETIKQKTEAWKYKNLLT